MIKPDSDGSLKISTNGHSIQIGPNFKVEFQRTLRIPDDGNEYPLPPGLGSFPISESMITRILFRSAGLKKADYSFPCISVRRYGCLSRHRITVLVL